MECSSGTLILLCYFGRGLLPLKPVNICITIEDGGGDSGFEVLVADIMTDGEVHCLLRDVAFFNLQRGSVTRVHCDNSALSLAVVIRWTLVLDLVQM